MEYIQLEHVEINDDIIFFTSSHTTYINVRKQPFHDIKELLKRCTILCKKLKESGCTVSHKHKTRKFLQDNADQYLRDYYDYLHNYGLAKSYSEWVTSAPIPIGTSENKDIKMVYKFRNRCFEAFYGGSILSKVQDFASNLNEIENSLADGCNFSKVCF